MTISEIVLLDLTWTGRTVDISGFVSGSASVEVGCTLVIRVELLLVWDDLLMWAELVLVRDAFYRKKKN